VQAQILRLLEGLRERRGFQSTRHAPITEQRFYLRGEYHAPALQRVEHGPDPGPVTRQNQTPATLIPQSDRELSVEVLHELESVLLIEMNDDFSIRVRVEAVSTALEFRAQLDIVEDLAVENDPDRAVFIVDRLVAAFEIDDAEPSVREAHLPILVEPKSVGPTVMQALDHLPEFPALRRGALGR